MENSKIPFADLILRLNRNIIPYQDLLQTAEWDERRKQILDRDKHVCQNCGKWATVKQAYDFEPGIYVAYDIWWDDSATLWYIGATTEKYKPSEKVFGKNPVIIAYNGGMAEIFAGKPYHLEVHHKYYLRSSLPWQYNDEGLVTLCNWCHREMHSNGALIPVYPNQSIRDAILARNASAAQSLSYYTPCSRCDGTGEMPAYNHVQHGICFRCNGAGFDELRDFRIR